MSTKLLVRHLPSQLGVHEKTDLLKHFGAKEVICMERRGKLVSIISVLNFDSNMEQKPETIVENDRGKLDMLSH